MLAMAAMANITHTTISMTFFKTDGLAVISRGHDIDRLFNQQPILAAGCTDARHRAYAAEA
ncbi:hypothetical protein GCM10022265_07970 [Marinobacter xestospongiae]